MSPALSLLLGSQAAGVLDAAVGAYGASLTGLRVADAHVAPTGGVRVRYVGELRHADGSRRNEVLVAATGDRIPAGAAVLAGEFEGAAVEVGVWRWPQDPVLPGLALAAHPLRLAELLAGAGVRIAAVPRITVRGYRPGQRAVLEVSDGCSRWFVKVVPPAAVAELEYRHGLLGAVLPVPPILVASPDGVVVLPEAPGTLLRHLVSRDAPYGAALPNPAVLHELLESLPGELRQMPVRRSHLQRVDQSARVLQTTVGHSQALSEVSDELRSASTESHPKVPVHGDFYDGQLLVAHGRISAVIDIDTAGCGERADEWATLLGAPLGGRVDQSACPQLRRRSAGLRRAPRGRRRPTAAHGRRGAGTGDRAVPCPATRLDRAHRSAHRRCPPMASSMRNNSSAAPATLMSARDS